MDALVRELRYAVRSLRRSPGFTSVAVVTLALGIGAATAVFSVVHGVLLRPLSYEEPDRLVRMVGYDTDAGPDAPSAPISLRDFLDWREMAGSFETMAAYNEWTANLDLPEGAIRPAGAEVTPEFFEVLGIRPELGRFFGGGRDVASDLDQLVLEHGFWRDRFGADTSLVGRSLVLDGRSYTVIGVAPREFEDAGLSAYGARPAFWRVTPRLADPAGTPRTSRQFTAVARLAPGTTREAAAREMDVVMRRLADRYPDAVTGRRVRLVPLKEDVVGEAEPTLLALFAAVGILLLVTCANLANLYLSRSASRSREFAVRTAMGAGTSRLGRQLLTESLVLATIGGVGGILLANLALDGLLALGGAELPRAEAIGLHPPVLLFALGASWATGLLFGLAPVLRLGKGDMYQTLRSGGARSSGRGGMLRLQGGLVVGQVALAVTILATAGLLTRSLLELQAVDPGFRSEDVLTAEIAPPPDVYGEHPDIDALHATLHRRLGSLPGVESVASVSILPMGDNYIAFGFNVEGRPPPEPGQTPSASIRTATPGYFQNVGIALLSGRGFVAGDRRDAPRVVVVSRSMARRWWPEENPVGERIEMRDASWEIVGVVADARQSTLGEPPEPAMYVPFAQSPSAWMNRNADLVLRTSQEPADLTVPVREVLRSVDSGIPILAIRPMEQLVAATTVTSRFRALLLCVFAGLALLIGAVGVFGVLSHQVARRRGEMAVRMAVGAPAGDVLGLVMRRGMGLVVVGIAVGILGAIAAARFISSLLFGIRSTDPPTLAAITLITLVVAALACYLPARRAAAVDPMIVLREE